ncbi:MAG: 50S ribosomal protein L25 [Candidatus Bipolaricaulota bacterium]
MHTLNATTRPGGKAEALRRRGVIPGVVYGPAMESTPIAVTRRDLQVLFSKITRSSQINLKIDASGKPQEMHVFLKAVDYDAVTDEPLHVDFYHPEAKHPLKLNVPVKITGESKGAKSGGILNVQFRTIPVRGLPKDIPHLFTIDVSELEVGDSVHVSELTFDKVEPLLPPERVLVTVIAPRSLVAETAEAAEAAGAAAEGAAEAPAAESAET